MLLLTGAWPEQLNLKGGNQILGWNYAPVRSVHDDVRKSVAQVSCSTDVCSCAYADDMPYLAQKPKIVTWHRMRHSWAYGASSITLPTKLEWW